MAGERSERPEQIDRMVERLRERLEAEWPTGETDAAGVEEIVTRIEREVLREITEEMLREQSRQRKGNQIACPCGGQARYWKDCWLELVTFVDACA